MTRAQELRLLAPLSRGWKSKPATAFEVERLRNARYEVSVAVPSASRPRIERRILLGWELHDYMRLHAGELAEFIVGVKLIEEAR